MLDPAKVKPRGPWVLVKVEGLPEKIGTLYIPDGSAMERLGHRSAKVIGVADGYYELLKREGQKDKMTYTRHDIKAGDRVVFRGHLKNANTFSLPKDHCLIHVQDLIGVLEDGLELGMALPYDN